MKTKFLNLSEFIYNKFKQLWESQTTNKLVSYALVIIFIISVIISYLDRNNLITLGSLDDYFANPFFAIDITFTLLLILELLSLIFVLPKSVAKSVGKQFELLSLIFIRSGFKEFSHIEIFEWTAMSDSVINMFAYAFGALAIFIILGFNTKLQLHTRLTDTEDDQKEFIQAKKLLALLLLLTFAIVGFYDTKILLQTGNYLHSFHSFYTVLIFSDIIIVLIALRYTLNYYKIFRYSAFVLATIFIRISLSIEAYYNVIVGVITVTFVLLLTLSYNYFLKGLPKRKLK
ncbi:MAG TPA: hypothetical protein ENK46_09610 [Flavobacteriia bacterium]|jgi:hypothetical protein|nr:hypothetical protein [Flavobacteriia bacterium]